MNPICRRPLDDEVSRELKLLTDRRDVLVAQRTSAINRLRWNVHELEPGRERQPRTLNAATHQQALRGWLDTVPGLVCELARAELDDVIRLCAEITALARRIGERVREVAPSLLAIPGCAELTAAKLHRRGRRCRPDVQKRMPSEATGSVTGESGDRGR